MNKIYRIGIDVGSTTMKVVVLDVDGQMVFTDYRRHNANIRQAAREMLTLLYRQLGNCLLCPVVTGSVGMGLSESFGVDFVQEVVAASATITHHYPMVRTLIDIGGEDSKMIFFEEGKVPDIRMNGSCAGGTGAFIDQTAVLLGVDAHELNTLASQSTTIYPIASRCGVFSKTDIQNLISRKVSKADIAASVFNAVAMQVVSSLARGRDIVPQVFFCGGPFAFLPELKKHFMRVLSLSETDCILPTHAEIIPATGCALLAMSKDIKPVPLTAIVKTLCFSKREIDVDYTHRLAPLFASKEAHQQWFADKQIHAIPRAPLSCDTETDYFLGVDSGSTTTKVVLLDRDGNLVYHDYQRNNGDSFQTFCNAIRTLYDSVEHPENVVIRGSAATGYGENLLKTAFGFNYGIVETIAHYTAAHKVSPKVSFILDIGGQDMKAIFVKNGSIQRIEINEACSSGCGSFIETFANMLNYPVAEFAQMSCTAKHPCDLGTRCTVFMNSKVKQAMREGAEVSDIAAGFSYSVVKNCLFKVLKIKNVSELGEHIVVQGGTFRNHSIVRALEIMTGCSVSFSDLPELMGAYGAALYALRCGGEQSLRLSDILNANSYQSEFNNCKGCDNHCTVKAFHFANGKTFYSGNNCEKIYSNLSETVVKGTNLFAEKRHMLFDRASMSYDINEQLPTIGIPRALGIYENFPFWHTLFKSCGIRVVLSQLSSNLLYAKGIRSIMSDNICFPAKLMHGHIINLVERKVDRIFYPYVVFEYKEDSAAHNSFNCPVVSGYSDVLKSSMDTAKNYNIPLDAPVITFRDEDLLRKSCREYLLSLGVKKNKIAQAIDNAIAAQKAYKLQITKRNAELYQQAQENHRMVILLAARPYHIDPLIEHKISQAIADMGVDVITENIATEDGSAVFDELNAVSQWNYPNRIFKAAHFVGNANYENLHFVELTSFGCGPDAFILDEVSHILAQYHKNLTALKIDDVNNIGSLRLRIRSLIESVRLDHQQTVSRQPKQQVKNTKIFVDADRTRTILAPYFAEGYSEFAPSLFKLAGYKLVNLPLGNQSDAETGLKFANNDVCYPATIVIGSIMNALQSGKYNLDETAVIVTQTGGQCRATNYLSLIKNAVIAAGFTQVPVLSFATGTGLKNNQPGFVIEWKKLIVPTVYTILFADCMARLYNIAVVRELQPGIAAKLREKYNEQAFALIESGKAKQLPELLKQAVKEYYQSIDHNKRTPIIGIVGEIYVKYNAFSNKNVIAWLNSQGVEVVAPSLFEFFTTRFANHHINKKLHIKHNSMSTFANDAIYRILLHVAHRFDRICASMPGYDPFVSVHQHAKEASEIVSLAGDFGEGWSIPAEFAHLAKRGVNNVVSLQPFGCIANHIISKGVEKQVKKIYPQMNLLFLDFDSSTSEANIFNRLHFMVENSRKQLKEN
ncbi:MAG: acyl-CoA dehydratase activase-related protein [Bacteroidales bacterium]|nr:acyl-CoA dehydratase activase-related protein [Bacteroidales bacterium]